MTTLLAICGYAGPTPFLAGMFVMGIVVAAMEWICGELSFRGLPALLTRWLIACAMVSALILAHSSVYLQREAGLFDLPSAARAAAFMGLFTLAVSLGAAWLQRDLNVSSIRFLLVSAQLAGFVVFFAVFALLPRLPLHLLPSLTG